MQIITNLSDMTATFPNPVVTLGNFDGIHLGHHKLFRHAIGHARSVNGTSIVFSFHPHPLKVLQPASPLKLINTWTEKKHLLERCGIDVFVCPDFNKAFATLSPEQFIREILVKRLAVQRIVVGHDYHFGYKRSGSVETLREMGKHHNFTVDSLDAVAVDGRKCSSSTIRHLIGDGNVDEAALLLGRPFNLQGQVVPGEQRGRTLGFPTANLATDQELLPPPGVYAVKVRHGRQLHNSVLNIGNNPTFCGVDQTIEAHLLDFSGTLYGEHLDVFFIARLRGEKKFTGKTALIEAIRDDITLARSILRDTPTPRSHEADAPIQAAV